MTKELIEEARREESIQDKLGDGFSEGSEERAFYYEHRDRYKRLADALEARQPSENDREVLAKQLRDIGAVRKVDQDCSCQDCEGDAEWVYAPLGVVLDHFKTNVSDAEPALLVCAWCPQPARGDAWHNDGKLHPSCGQIDHGQGWVPPYTPRAAAPGATTEQAFKKAEAFDKAVALSERRQTLLKEAEAERDAAVAAIERVRAVAMQHRSVEQHNEMVPVTDIADLIREPSSADYLAALDGAPEPEAGQLPETGQEKRDEDGDLISSGEHRKVLHQGMYVCDSCVNDLGLNVRWDRAGFMEGHPLPVEGESKP